MSGESDPDFIDRLAQSIADGNSINWDEELDRLTPDDRLKGLLELLRVVDGVAEVHRSLNEPSQATPPTEILTPAPDAGHPRSDLGQWRHLVLLRKIGEGGFGEVYHAHDTWLDHPVALKLFKPKVANRESANRILHEARKLARIRHPNIVTVHGADSDNGQVGFWMDLVEGTTLEQIVRNGRLSAGEAAYIGQEVCRALAAVHLAGIVHRDVKAQNVMRAADGGRIILMDFGAGEFMKDRAANARKQGTPLYLAPELFRGGDGSPQSDIYSAGVLLYYLVTGNFPVQGRRLRSSSRPINEATAAGCATDGPTFPISSSPSSSAHSIRIRRAGSPRPERWKLRWRGNRFLESVRFRVGPGAVERTPLQKISIGAVTVAISTAFIGWISMPCVR